MRKNITQRHDELWNVINASLRKEKDENVIKLLETQKQKLKKAFEDFQNQELKAKDPANYSFSLPEETRLLKILEKDQKAQNKHSKHSERNPSFT
jgi:hypothetical protein